MSIEEMWNYLIDNNICTENELKLITDINGYSKETMEDCLYARTGERYFDEEISE